MQIKKLWETPELSWNGGSEITFQFSGLDAVLKIEYQAFETSKCVCLQFHGVRGYKHLGNYLYDCYNKSDPLGCFETLIEMIDSDWLKELKKRDVYHDMDSCKHYALANHNDGQFEILAEGYVIEET